MQQKRKYAPLTAGLLGALTLTAPLAARAQQQQPVAQQPSVAPQIEIDGEGAITLEGDRNRTQLPGEGRASSSRINLTDSALLASVTQRLYRHGAIGSLALGGTTTENVGLGSGRQIFLHQAYVDYQAQTTEAYLGRTNNPANLFDYPTLRGDDLITYTKILNPFTSGEDTNEHRYGDIAAVALNQGLTTFENIHVQHQISSAGDVANNEGLNSYGVTVTRMTAAPGMESIARVPMFGFGYERQEIGRAQGGQNNVFYGGGVINLKPSPVHLVELRLLDIYATGNNLNHFSSLPDSFRAASNSASASLRYLDSPFGKPGYQVALTAGYKTYQKVHDASSYGLALTGTKRLGDGFDLVAQYTHEHRAHALASVYGGASDDNSVQVGFVFSFTNIFNNTIGPRRSLLNLQHQYIPNP